MRKLPKQWTYWLKQAGLKPEGSSRWRRRNKSPFYFKGYGRRWRVISGDVLQVGDNDFDRWANSVEHGEKIVSLTEAGIVATVRKMLIEIGEE